MEMANVCLLEEEVEYLSINKDAQMLFQFGLWHKCDVAIDAWDSLIYSNFVHVECIFAHFIITLGLSIYK